MCTKCSLLQNVLGEELCLLPFQMWHVYTCCHFSHSTLIHREREVSSSHYFMGEAVRDGEQFSNPALQQLARKKKMRLPHNILVQ